MQWLLIPEMIYLELFSKLCIMVLVKGRKDSILTVAIVISLEKVCMFLLICSYVQLLLSEI
jgi:hypothetical protein